MVIKNRKSIIALFTVVLNTFNLFCLEEKEIMTKEISLSVEFSGVTHAYDEYDIRADFDGSVAFVYSSVFDVVRASETALRLVTGEVAALLKTAKDENEKKDILKRWKNMFRYSDIKIPSDGIITKIHIDRDSYIKKGDKLLTVAKKMRVIARSKNPFYMTPTQGLDGIVEDRAGRKYRVILSNYIMEDKDKWVFFLDFDAIPDLKVGEVVKGNLIIKTPTQARVIPNQDIFEYGGKKYILIEFEPGVITEKDTEILSFRYNYLKITKDIVNYVK